jgi:hypothetical protein
VARPVIALLTDFGTRDHYVGAMKGVALDICPEATLVDITHEIAPQDVAGGALELAAAYKYFPPNAVFVAVVDPGVGSSRRALAAEAAGFRFVAPDNGLLGAVFDDVAPNAIVEITEPRYMRPTVSRTFEGRDRFAPAAAWLAAGVDLSALGPAAGAIRTLDLPQPRVGTDGIAGEVVRVDRFGNLITNIDRRSVERFGSIAITAGAHAIARVVATYAEAPAGELCALVGSTGHLEIAVSGGSAAARLALGRGAAVHVSSRA